MNVAGNEVNANRGPDVELGFNSRLESMRGLAALCVLLTHCFGIFQIDGINAYWTLPFFDQPANAKILTLIGSLLNPSGAVVAFFIISGYVLSLSLFRSRKPLRQQFGPYIVKRAFRLLPAMWVSILLFAMVREVVPNYVDPSYQSAFYSILVTPITLGLVLQNCFLYQSTINPVTWTMFVEVVGSLALPLMIVGSGLGKRAALGLMALLIATAWLTRSGEFDARRFLFCFDAGVALACFPRLTEKVRLPIPLFLGGVFLLFIQRIASINGIRGTVLLTVGATMLLVAVIGAKDATTFRWLDIYPARFLGKISYSLYLLHLAIIYALMQLLACLGFLKVGGLLPTASLTVGTLVFTTIAASMSYTFVELPMILYGKKAYYYSLLIVRRNMQHMNI